MTAQVPTNRAVRDGSRGRWPRGFWIVFSALWLCALAPLWLCRFLPLMDLPKHLEAIAI